MRINAIKTALALTALLAAVTASPAGRAAANSTSCTPTWKLVPTPAAPGSLPSLQSVTALGTKDVWISGVTTTPWMPWVLQWSGRTVGTSTQVPGASLTAFDLGATSFESDTEGWGLAGVGIGLPASNVAEHWHGGRWTMTPLPLPADPATTAIFLHGVATVSTTDAWAVGGLYKAGKGVVGDLQALGSVIEHWDGTTWTVVPDPVANQPDTFLSAVEARTATDVWAVGRQSEGAGNIVPLVEHWDGTAWSVSRTPAVSQPAALYAVSASGANDVWAVGGQTMTGTTNTAVPLVEHWDGATWTVAQGLPDVGNARLISVYAASRADVWAIVETPDGANQLLHTDGTSWTATILPGPQELGLRYFYSGLDGTGSGDVWAVGEVTDLTTLTGTAQVAHLSCGKD